MSNLVEEYAKKLANDLMYAAPEMQVVHIVNRLEQFAYELELQKEKQK